MSTRKKGGVTNLSRSEGMFQKNQRKGTFSAPNRRSWNENKYSPRPVALAPRRTTPSPPLSVSPPSPSSSTSSTGEQSFASA